MRTPRREGDLAAGCGAGAHPGGTGFVVRRDSSGSDRGRAAKHGPAKRIVYAGTGSRRQRPSVRTPPAGVETVVVTSSKIKGDIQTVPIAITALSQEQLTSRQIAGGPTW